MKLDRQKIEGLLLKRGWSLQKLSKECGISRQTLYNMFQGESVFSSSFEKLLKTLNVRYQEIVKESFDITEQLSTSPASIQKALFQLQQYAEKHQADLFLFGSRSRKQKGIRSDWDFALFFPQGDEPRGFSLFKQKIQDMSFPHRLDIVCLNHAPGWFLKSIEDDAQRLTGSTEYQRIFQRSAA